jgi:hypothetical protein
VLRRLLRLVLTVVLAFVVFSFGAVLAPRWIDPPFTTVMLLQEGPVGDLEHTWVPRDAIAWDAARAVIAAEDQRFAEHRGILAALVPPRRVHLTRFHGAFAAHAALRAAITPAGRGTGAQPQAAGAAAGVAVLMPVAAGLVL